MSTNQPDVGIEPTSFNIKGATIFEFDPYISEPSQCCTLREYPSDQVAQWLRDTCTTAARASPATFSGRVKLVLLNIDLDLWDSAEQPFELLEELTEILGIPGQVFAIDDIVESRFYPSSPESYTQQSTADTVITRGSVVHLREGVAWAHFASSSCASGVAWHAGSRNEGSLAYMVSHMAEYRSIAHHPCLLPLLELQSLTRSLKGWQVYLEGEIRDAQVKSGFHLYAVEQKPGVMSDDVDLGLLSAVVSGSAANMSAEELCLKGLLSLAAAIRDENASLVHHQPSSERARAAQLFVDAQVTFLERQCKTLLQRAESWQRKAAIVIQGLFNLIAQRDQMANFSIARESTRLAEQGQQIALKSAELAEETKRDSTSMKAIAAVTMCFLPGTFVASFLAMPIFQLDSNAQSLTTHEMWLYWSITVPLTLVTIGAWFLWDRWSNHRRQLADLASTRKRDEMYSAMKS